METAFSTLTVFFEDPFWVGMYERRSGQHYEACKLMFGAEPKDCEVWEYLLKNWNRLIFSPSIRAGKAENRPVSPKRLQREIHRQVQGSGVGTKAQQAIKLQQEQGKERRKVCSREQREAEKKRRFQMHEEQRREKHRGR